MSLCCKMKTVDAEDRPACPTGSRTSPLLYGALPHRSRAGQRMRVVGAGARASDLSIKQDLPACQRNSCDARSRSPCSWFAFRASPRARRRRAHGGELALQGFRNAEGIKSLSSAGTLRGVAEATRDAKEPTAT
jgi:hypothetical protein